MATGPTSAPSEEPNWYPTPPSPFDIVTCWFPETGNTPGPELRPCLVTHVYRLKPSGRFGLRVLFGTKNLKLMRSMHLDLIVQKYTDIVQFNLSVATRFDLDLAAKLLYNDKYFGVWSGRRTPILSSLTQEYINDYAYKIGMRQPPSGTKTP